MPKKVSTKIAEKLSEMMCKSTKVYKTTSKTPFYDEVVVTTARSGGQIKGLISQVEKILKDTKTPLRSIEYKNGSSWCLIDAGLVVINIFAPGQRYLMKFDDLYKGCPCKSYGEDDEEEVVKEEYKKPHIDYWR